MINRVRTVIIERPFELFVSILCAMSGASVIFTPNRPGTISESLPPWLQIAWGVSLCGGGILVLVGIWTRAIKPDWFRGGLSIEFAGMVFMACATSVYSLVLVTQAPLGRALVSIALLTSLSASCVARAYAIRVVLKRLQDPRIKGSE